MHALLGLLMVSAAQCFVWLIQAIPAKLRCRTQTALSCEPFADDAKGAAIDSDESDDEVVMGAPGDVASSDDESDSDYDWDNDPEGRLGLGPALKVRHRADSDASESEDEAAKQAEIDNVAKAWGKKRHAYYQEGDVADEAADSEEERALAEEEEEEAARLAKLAAASKQDADYGIASLAAPAAASAPGSRSKQAKGVNGGAEKVARRRGALSKQDKLDLVVSDAPELLGVLEELASRVGEVKRTLEPVLAAVKEGGLPTTGGVAYLEVRQQLLLTYVSHLAFYLMLKAQGQSLASHPVMSRLVRIRTMIEKAKPLDAKLKFQLDRVLRAADLADAESGALAPNPAAMLAHGDAGSSDSDGQSDGQGEDDSEDATSDAEEEQDADGVYKPLKRSAVVYEEDDGASKAARSAARQRQKLVASRLYADLRSQFSERPEEQVIEGATGSARAANVDNAALAALDAKIAKMEAARETMEEESFVRVAMTKDERKLRKARQKAKSQLATLGDVEDFTELQRGLEDKGPAASGAGRFGATDWAAATSASLKSGGSRSLQEYAAAAAASGGGSSSLGGIARKRRRGELGSADADADAASSSKRGRGLDGDSDFGDSDLEDLYKRGKGMRDARREEKAARGQEIYDARRSAAAAADSDEEVDDKRKVGRDIMKNKGLTKYRKKSQRNPRVAYREKAEKKAKRYKNQVAPMRTKESDRYAGESTGIRASISRSTKL